MNSNYINEGLEYALKTYIENKDKTESSTFSSFLVVAIRKLVLIYGELDIINPFISKNENIFKDNLKKYGATDNELNLLFDAISRFYDNEKLNKVPNNEFINIEKILVDLFILKKVNHNILEEEKREFINLLYSPDSNSEYIISYNFMHSNTTYEVINYFMDKDRNNQKIELEVPKKVLTPEAYKIIEKNYTDICLLDPASIEKINEEVYKALNVNKNAVNFDYQFDKALYEFFHKDDKISSGNGYVDILLIMSIICTIVLIILILTIIFL